jgi:hypothetical protein
MENPCLWKCYARHSRSGFFLKVRTIFEDPPGIGIALVGATRRVAQGEATPRPYRTGRVAQSEAAPRPYRAHGPAPGSVGAIVGQVKSLSQKAINRLRGTPGAAVWERNYFEHVIRNPDALERIREYICNNPLRWPNDRENPERVVDRADELEDLLKADVGRDW